MRTRVLMLLMALLVAWLPATPAMAHAEKQVKQVKAAEEVLKFSVTAPDKRIPQELLERAECIGVFPGVKKGAFVVGGEFGRGVFTCRQKDGTMGAPAFFTMGGPSLGWQFGGQSADLVLLIMNDTGVRKLLQDKFTLGGEAAAVAGPVGRTAQAATDIQLNAQILSWSRSRGLFLGASLEGVVIKPNKDAIELFYERPLTARDILVEHSVDTPKSAKSFVKTASEYSRRAS
ncbi:MAG: lipid-binding SYLF domain-containing protein [Acidobacteria bacterium]|nr:lipid-binding SYLF domain-containing protein [Acidobacteriota bacterium]